MVGFRQLWEGSGGHASVGGGCSSIWVVEFGICLGVWVRSCGFGVSGSGLGVGGKCFGFRVSGFGFRVYPQTPNDTFGIASPSRRSGASLNPQN